MRATHIPLCVLAYLKNLQLAHGNLSERKVVLRTVTQSENALLMRIWLQPFDRSGRTDGCKSLQPETGLAAFGRTSGQSGRIL